MADGKIYILLGLLLLGLIPLIKAKPPELSGEVMGTQFERINGLGYYK